MDARLVYPGEKTRYAILATFSTIFWLALIVGTAGIALAYLLLLFIAYLFAQSALVSHLRGSGARIDAGQFPDLHQRILLCAEKIGMPAPEVYLLNSGGVFNAFATRFLGRNYVVLYAKVIDALTDRPDAINFYIGHELGHLHRGHLAKAAFVSPMSILPLIGAAYYRAKEYTCDRYGLMCCESVDDAVAGLAVLAAGEQRWKTLSTRRFIQQADMSTGFWMSYHELAGDYPWLTKRMLALPELSMDREPQQPRRNSFAYLLALFTPRFGAAGSGGANMLITVAIAGILAAIAIPAYQDYVIRAKVTSLVSKTSPFREAVVEYATQNKKWPADLSVLNIPDNVTVDKTFSTSVEIRRSGVIAFIIDAGQYKGKSLLWVPNAVKKEDGSFSISWKCGSDGLPEKILPPICR